MGIMSESKHDLRRRVGMTSREQVALEEIIAARTSSWDAGVNSVKILGGSEGIGWKKSTETGILGNLEQSIKKILKHMPNLKTGYLLNLDETII